MRARVRAIERHFPPPPPPKRPENHEPCSSAFFASCCFLYSAAILLYLVIWAHAHKGKERERCACESGVLQSMTPGLRRAFVRRREETGGE